MRWAAHIITWIALAVSCVFISYSSLLMSSRVMGCTTEETLASASMLTTMKDNQQQSSDNNNNMVANSRRTYNIGVKDGDNLHASCRQEPLREHPHAGARDDRGCAEYVHDTTYLRRNPLHLTWKPLEGRGKHICRQPLGKGPEGIGGESALKKIRVVPDSPFHPKVLCIVYTHSERHNILRSISETWGAQCDGFLATSNLTDPSIGAVNILHKGREAYENMWEKIRSTWSYVYTHYLNDYDWFYIAGDDTFVIASNLRNALTKYTSDRQPMYVGFSMIRFPYKRKRYCGGGAGYTINRAALRILIEERYSKANCGMDLEKANQEASDEDRIISDCLREIVNCTHSVDDKDEQRFHILTPNYHALWKESRYPANWLPSGTLLPDHGIPTAAFREGLEGVSETSVSFHLIPGTKLKWLSTPPSIWLDNGMRRLHAIVHGLCPSEKKED